jgi:UDP-N-acetylmuramoyl-L-alanyl-D-glutamate--2,6-diaminopimelate ligase
VAAAMQSSAMRLGELLGSGAGQYAGVEISDLVVDSRDVTPGAAFLAVPGRCAHGLDFAVEAIAKGAAIVLYEPDAAHVAAVPAPSIAVPRLGQRLGELAERFYSRKATPPAIAGITGTNGKTTVAYLLAQALTKLGRSCGYVGTLGFGIPPLLAPHRLTTPDCLTLHRELAAMPVTEIAMEISSHALAQGRIEGLTIRLAVFTNLTRDHLDEHGDFASYARAKASLFARPSVDRVVLNLDDPFADDLLGTLGPHVRVIGVSLGGDARAELRASIDAMDIDGMRLTVAGPAGSAVVRTRLIGEFNAQNLLVALGALIGLDTPLEEAASALELCEAPPGRMERFGGSGAPIVIVDYAHTPDALGRALDALVPLASGEVWCVFGCGGDRDRGKRPLMGREAAARADHIVLTDDNPRNEDPAAITTAIRKGIGTDSDVVIEHDRQRAIELAIARARRGDVVLVAGKGHETRQITAHGERPVDDRRIVAAALGRRA